MIIVNFNELIKLPKDILMNYPRDDMDEHELENWAYSFALEEINSLFNNIVEDHGITTTYYSPDNNGVIILFKVIPIELEKVRVTYFIEYWR